MTLTDQIIIVTGAGRGLGARTATHLAANGAAVALCARTQDEIDGVASAINDAGGSAISYAIDVGRPEDAERFVDEVVGQIGPPTALINNAAVLGPVGPLEETDLAAWWDAMRVTVLGTASMTRAVARRMLQGGVIVNLSGGGIGGPGVAPRISSYTSAKAAVVELTETVALELAERDIRVNAVAPGAFATTFTTAILKAGANVAGDELFEATQKTRQAPDGFDRYVDLLMYLLSDESKWLTGRLLSARWETPDRLRAVRSSASASLFKLRRIDDDLYGERLR